MFVCVCHVSISYSKDVLRECAEYYLENLRAFIFVIIDSYFYGLVITKKIDFYFLQSAGIFVVIIMGRVQFGRFQM